jgi:23S rRNA (uracil1939-C5)-methyltransferase
MTEVVKKNDQVEITIEAIGSEGEGIGRYQGYTLFVKDTVMGDVALVQVMKTGKTYGYARLVKLITPSKFRTEPKCPIAAKCGGCQLMHVNYEKQLEYKQDKVRQCLTRIGGFSDVRMEPICGWRTLSLPQQITISGRKGKGRKYAIGFYAGERIPS